MIKEGVIENDSKKKINSIYLLPLFNSAVSGRMWKKYGR